MANLPKLCVICGEDCAGQPRTKDAQGRYYHNECYERAREVQEGRAAPVDPGPPEPESMNLLDEIVDDALGDVDVQNTCASCGHPLAAGDVICMSCGFNAQSGETAHLEVKKQKRAKASGGSGADGLAAQLLTPFGVNMMALMVVVLLIVVFYATQSVAALGALVLFLYVYMLTASVVITVVGFMEGFIHGLLSLCLWPYQLYFVFFVTDNQWAKWFYIGALIMTVIAYGMLMTLA